MRFQVFVLIICNCKTVTNRDTDREHRHFYQIFASQGSIPPTPESPHIRLGLKQKKYRLRSRWKQLGLFAGKSVQVRSSSERSIEVMVLILDGSLEIDAHVRSNLCYLIYLKHLIRSRGITNWIFVL